VLRLYKGDSLKEEELSVGDNQGKLVVEEELAARSQESRE
jgi:hypothetical protein